MKSDDWRRVFCGRDNELEQLHAAWRQVKSGSGPRFVGVLGERGMGKTRLVQEFYCAIAQNDDPQDYWPDGMTFVGNSIAAGPSPNDDHFQTFSLAEREMPFLWWGFRIPDPYERNFVPKNLRDFMDNLLPFLECTARKREAAVHRQGLWGKAKASTQSGMIDEAKGVVIDLVKDTVPFVSLVEKAARFAASLAKGQIQASQIERDLDTTTIAGEFLVKERGIIDDALAAMELVFSQSQSVGAGVPTIVFIDDAQFARVNDFETDTWGEESTLIFLRELWDRACLNQWPLLLIATHWIADWDVNADGKVDKTFARKFAAAADGRLGLHQQSISQLIRLGTDVSLVPMTQLALPSMPASDQAFLTDRAGGNPQYLQEILLAVIDANGWVNKATGALRPSARELISGKEFNLLRLICERLIDPARTPVHVRDAVLIGSVQGMQFPVSLALEASKELDVAVDSNSFLDSEDPHHYLSGPKTGTATFVQRATRDAAFSLVSEKISPIEDVTLAWVKAAQKAAAKPVFDLSFGSFLSNIQIQYVTPASTREAKKVAAEALLGSIPDLRSGDTKGIDFAEAARLGMEFEKGRLDGRWSLVDLDFTSIRKAINAISYWYKVEVSLPLGLAALETARNRFHEQPTSQNEWELLQSLLSVGDSYSDSGKKPLALSSYQEGLTTANLRIQDSLNLEMRNYKRLMLQRIASCWEGLEGPKKALPFQLESLALAEQLHEEQKDDYYLRSVLISLVSVGRILGAIEGPTAALPYYNKAQDIARDRVNDPSASNSHDDLRHASQNLGKGYIQSNLPQLALPLYEQALTIARNRHQVEQSPASFAAVTLALGFFCEGLVAVKGFDENEGYQVAYPLLKEALGFAKASHERIGTQYSATLLLKSITMLITSHVKLEQKEGVQEVIADLDSLLLTFEAIKPERYLNQQIIQALTTTALFEWDEDFDKAYNRVNKAMKLAKNGYNNAPDLDSAGMLSMTYMGAAFALIANQKYEAALAILLESLEFRGPKPRSAGATHFETLIGFYCDTLIEVFKEMKSSDFDMSVFQPVLTRFKNLGQGGDSTYFSADQHILK